MLPRILLGSCLSLLAACSCEGAAPNPSGDGGTPAGDGGQLPPGTVALHIDPRGASLSTDGLTPATQRFAVTAEKADHSREDVTGRAGYQLSNTGLGQVSAGLFTSGLRGGASDLVASLGGLSATATITVRLSKVEIGMGVPSDPGGIFAGAPSDPRRAPELVYPNDGVLLPSNLGAVEVHYRRGNRSNQLFEISFSGAGSTFTAYVRCTALANGCLYTPSAAAWTVIAESNRGGAPVIVKVRGTDDRGTAVGASAEARLHISAAPVQGGLYYWTTSNGTGIMRVDFGSPQPPERFYPFSGGGCHGCHALSRNGRHMTVSVNGQFDGRISIVDVAARTRLIDESADQREQFQSWNPAGDRFAGVWADGNPVDTNIRIRDGRSGAVLETIPIGFEPDHPDWSPRGDRILFTKVTHHETTQRPGRGGISYVEALAGGGWSAPRELIAPADGVNHYYPSYAPDAQFFIYDRSTCDRGSTYGGECDADADDSAKLFAMKSEGGAAVELAKANAPGVADGTKTTLCNTFPRWAPFTDPRRADGSGRVMWFTFSSRRAYGLREPGGGDMWIWMAAIDPDAVLAGNDGSYAAFALPFQDLGTSNHIAQWTTQIVPPVGTDGGVDPGNGGDGGAACLGIGEICSPTADRCCSGTVCAQNGPDIFLCRPNF